MPQTKENNIKHYIVKIKKLSTKDTQGSSVCEDNENYPVWSIPTEDLSESENY